VGEAKETHAPLATNVPITTWTGLRVFMQKSPHADKSTVDVPADNPVGTMERFTNGLRRVLGSPRSPGQRVEKHPRISKVIRKRGPKSLNRSG
jgi:hypothetical protein